MSSRNRLYSPIFPLSLFCVGTYEHSSTSRSHELTKRALESKDDLGSRGLSFPPFPSRNDFAHSFYLALTRLWAIYHLLCYVHFPVFTLHAMPLSMTLPCNCDPCLHLPMIHHVATHMCICIFGGDPCCYCHVYHVPHAIDAILLISCLYACEMSCALFMTTICTHDMFDMIPPSTLHLRTTSLLDLTTMIAFFVASPMFMPLI